ncbi:MAG TPA: TPM domain-containing protein [Candidatus Omnitrophota bacterium]|nr:TPM domain-containing protein [Candidatus Omnitrophota bacterium]
MSRGSDRSLLLIVGRYAFCRKFLVFFLGAFLSIPFVSAFEIPSRPDGYVTDRAGLLSPTAKIELEKKLSDFDLETSNQVAVAVFSSLEGENLEDISMRIAEAWKPGRKDRDNGVLLLIFEKERQIRIEVGYGLEGALTDAVSGQIIRGVMAPLFKQGNYDQGVLEGANAVMAAIQGEFEGGPIEENSYVPQIMFLIFIFLYLWFLSQPSRIGRRRGIHGGFWIGGGPGRGGFGGGFRGGGGGFGGGGASGRW